MCPKISPIDTICPGDDTCQQLREILDLYPAIHGDTRRARQRKLIKMLIDLAEHDPQVAEAFIKDYCSITYH